MQNRPILNHSQVKTLLALRHCRDDNLFSGMPLEVILKISGYDLEDNWRDYETGLDHIVNGKLKELKVLLEAKPFLVLFKDKNISVLTPRGTKIKGKSFYECALGERDPDIKALIEPVFLNVKGGEKEMKAQFECYLKAMPCQQLDDLSWLFETLVASPMEDVVAELKTGEDYDLNYCSQLRQGSWRKGSDLRDALDKFREEELALACLTIDQPGLHGNDQGIIHVYELLYQYEDRLIVGNNYDKLRLAWRQILGFKQLLNLTAYDRIVFASGQIDEAVQGKEINRGRGFNYKHSSGAVPTFNIELIKSRSGWGFDFYISIYGAGAARVEADGAWGRRDIKIYVEQKHQACRTLCGNSQPKNGHSV